MKFKETKIKGAYIIEIEPQKDKRGFFARSFCKKEFQKHNLSFRIAQCNISYNKKKGILRGMHFQAAPYEEAKIVSCIAGAIYDVIIDLRPGSSTFGKWLSVELNMRNFKMLYIPKGFAHGFQALEDDTTVFYQMSEFYHPKYARGIRWDDPYFKIRWPRTTQRIISERDMAYPDFSPCRKF